MRNFQTALLTLYVCAFIYQVVSELKDPAFVSWGCLCPPPPSQ